jgi:hypothetical protein
MRAVVLAVTALAGDVDTQYGSTTTTGGSDLTDVYGPLHAVQLANGTPGSYRQHHPQLRRDGSPSAPRHRDAIAWSLPLSLPLLDGAGERLMVLL